MTGKQRAELQALEEMSDDQIDTSDIPEALDWTGGRRGVFYDLTRPQLPPRQHAKECEEKSVRVVTTRRTRGTKYRGDQRPIVHLEADLRETTAWADSNGQRWAFTDSNAGSPLFNDWSDFADLDNIDWQAVQAWYWQEHKHGKQTEFLVERQFPWNLVQRIGVLSRQVQDHVARSLLASTHRPPVQVRTNWYY